MYNPVYSLLTILLFGVIFFPPLAAKGHGRIMEQGAIELVEGIVMAIAELADDKVGIETAH